MLYKDHVRPHLEYANRSWNPFEKNDIEELEKNPKRDTKLVISLKYISYTLYRQINTA